MVENRENNKKNRENLKRNRRIVNVAATLVGEKVWVEEKIVFRKNGENLEILHQKTDQKKAANHFKVRQNNTIVSD